jgi:transposase-like protein
MTRSKETTTMKKDTPTLGKVIEIDEARIRDHLGEVVRGSVEETLNALLDAEADALCGASRYARSVDLHANGATRLRVNGATS